MHTDRRHAPPSAGMLLGACTLLILADAEAEPAAFAIDPEHLSIGFLVEHLGFARTLGFFQSAEGTFEFDEDAGTIANVRVVVDTDSVFTNHERRDEHLRSGDFLDTGDHAQMVFTAASSRRTGERTFVIDGELTLLGTTRPLTLEATLNKSGDYPIGRNAYAIGVSATGQFERSAYGMSYGVDNGWVGDTVEILIEFEARRQ